MQGYIQYELGDLEDSGKMGAVTRKKREVREKEKKQLASLDGKSLYLEALQLILRSQLLWLVREKGYKEELETVVRDLWDLRIRGFGSLVPHASISGEEGELQMFSSQPDSEPEMEVRPKANKLSWDPERGQDWPMPRMIDTLCLCYLGCLLLRIPTSMGQIFRWANGGNIPYRYVVSSSRKRKIQIAYRLLKKYLELPEEMRDRMPSSFTRVLKLPLHSPLRGGQLHSAALHLAYGFHHNYQVIFPALNGTSLLVEYSKDLALPSK